MEKDFLHLLPPPSYIGDHFSPQQFPQTTTTTTSENLYTAGKQSLPQSFSSFFAYTTSFSLSFPFLYHI
jgi:hypothetical protein